MRGIGRLGRRNPWSKELEEEQGAGQNAVSFACVLRQAFLTLESSLARIKPQRAAKDLFEKQRTDEGDVVTLCGRTILSQV